MSSHRKKVLIMGEDTRGFLACVRSLGRQGLEVHVAPADFKSPALKSRYIHQVHRLPAYIGDGGEWVAAVRALLSREKFSLVMPTNDPNILPLARHRRAYWPDHKIATPDDDAIAVLFDKLATRKLADSVRVPLAKGIAIYPDTTCSVALEALKLPLVLKSTRSYKMSNLGQRQRARIIKHVEELQEALAIPRTETMLLEQYFVGDTIGVSILASNGRVLQYFQHVRAHESPPDASGYRMSQKLDPALTAACGRMVAKLGYTGLAMCEFKKNNQTGEWILLEINARPWGSLPLPLSLGIDFPYWWYRLLDEGWETPATQYAAGRFSRNFTIDMPFLVNALRERRNRPAALLAFGARSVGEFGRNFIGLERSDTLVLDDPSPGFSEAIQIVRRIGKKLFGRRTRAPVESIARIAERVQQQPDATLHVEFVCTGNICRSPYAEKLFAKGIGTLQHDIEVSAGSSGTFLIEGRPSPQAAIAAAVRQRDVDLSNHRSRCFTNTIPVEADLVIVFDEANEEAVLARYPDVDAKLFWLSDFLNGTEQGAPVLDPYGLTATEYDVSYRLIERGVDALVATLVRAIDHNCGPLPSDLSSPR